MKKYILFLMVIAIISSCTDPKDKLFRQIKDLEQSEEMGTPEALKQLAELHKKYGLEYKDSTANFYLYSAATWYFYADDANQSKSLYHAYLKRDIKGDQSKNAMLNLGQIYAEARDYDSADLMISMAIEKYLPSNSQWNNIVAIYKDKIESNRNVSPVDYEHLSLGYTALGAFEPATAALDSAIHLYPTYEKRGNLLYRCGFIAWEYMGNPAKAKVYYDQFLKEYPEHEQAEQVETILESGMLEMTDEDILNMLKGKANSES